MDHQDRFRSYKIAAVEHELVFYSAAVDEPDAIRHDLDDIHVTSIDTEKMKCVCK